MIGHKSAFARICRCDQRKRAGIFHMRLCLRRQLRPWTRCDGVRERGEWIECRLIPTIPQRIGSWMFLTPPSRLGGQNAGDAGRHHGFIRSRWAHLEHMMTARCGNSQGAFARSCPRTSAISSIASCGVICRATAGSRGA